MNNMLLDERQVIKKVDDRLNLLYKNDKNFIAEFQYFQVYYTKKFEQIISDQDKKMFNQWLQSAMIEQFQRGYLLVEQYYNDEGAHIDESLFKQPQGMFTEDIPLILHEMSLPSQEQGNSFDEIIDTDTTHKLIIWAVERYEDLRPMIKQVSFDLTCLGARQALRDRSHLIDVKHMELDTEERKLGNIGDYQFINPEMYLKINHVSQNVEYWDINYWSSNLQGIQKIGEALVLSEEEYVNTKVKISYHLSMLSTISDTAIEKVAEHHIAKLLNYVEADDIQYHLTSVKDYLAHTKE